MAGSIQIDYCSKPLVNVSCLETLAKDWLLTEDFWSSESILQSFESPYLHLWSASSGGVDDPWLGMLLIQVTGNDAEILYIYLTTKARGHGVALKMLHKAREFLVDLKLEGNLFLEVRLTNHPARKLYETFGMIQTGTRKRYYKDGEDALIYECPIKKLTD